MNVRTRNDSLQAGQARLVILWAFDNGVARDSTRLKSTQTMTTLLVLLAYAILLVGVIGWLWIVILAFGEGETLWGIGCLIFPPLTVVYGRLNYQEAKIPFWIVTIGFGLNIAAKILGTVLALNGF